MNDTEENLNPTSFDVPDSTVIFCKLQHSWNMDTYHNEV